MSERTECAHGQLARQCNICELEQELARERNAREVLAIDNDRLRKQLSERQSREKFMAEDECNDVINLARVRSMQYSMMWLNSLEENEKECHRRVHKLLGEWIKILEKKTGLSDLRVSNS